MKERLILHLKFSYLCTANEKDRICAAGTDNYRSGQAEKSPWAGRKNEVLSATRDSRSMFSQKNFTNDYDTESKSN